MSIFGERTGWRDEQLSKRHRRWGFDCPAVDIDFLVVEYHLSAPVALIDYKHCKKNPLQIDLEHPSFKALRNLADRSPALPFMIVRYWPDDWAFSSLAMNDEAKKWYGDQWYPMSELEYVESLYAMKAVLLQQSIVRHLKTVTVEEAERGLRAA